MKDVVAQLDRWVARGDRVALATVVDTRRSAPRPPGSKMLINDSGEVYGAISGGCVEGAVVQAAIGVLAGGRPRLLSFGIADDQAWDVGLPCGGESSELRGDLFVDVTAPPPRLLIFGAVEHASHLSRLARDTGWRPYVIDPRAQFATRERFPDAFEVVVAWPREALARLGGIDRATYVAVLTHDPKIDDQVLALALQARPAYIGASRHDGRLGHAAPLITNATSSR